MTRPPSRSGLWLAWLTATLGSFAVIETVALRKRSFPPLSAVLRWLLGVHPRTPWGRLAVTGFAGVWVWLVCHLLHRVSES